MTNITDKSSVLSFALILFSLILLPRFSYALLDTCLSNDPFDLAFNASSQIDSRINGADPSTSLNMYAGNRPIAVGASWARNAKAWTNNGVWSAPTF